ncbi:MAG TPA: response regulator [Burkholderiales bacterium]
MAYLTEFHPYPETVQKPSLFFVDQESLFYARTALGEASYEDASVTMSPAFRRMLRELDGRRSVADLAKLFPHLDQEDMQMWIGELLHQQMIMPVEPGSAAAQAAAAPRPAAGSAAAPRTAPPTARATPPAGARVAPTPPAGAAPATAEREVQQIAEEIQPWLAELGKKPLPAEGGLSRTARMVAIEASTTASSMGREGFFMSPDGPRQPLTPGAQRLILVVEDDQMQAAMVSRILEASGYKVKVARSGAQATTAMTSRPAPDLVLLDVELPDTDGFTLLKQIRAHPLLQFQRVVMLTARADRADIAKGVLLGADGYLTKPFRPETIKMALQQALPG